MTKSEIRQQVEECDRQATRLRTEVASVRGRADQLGVELQRVEGLAKNLKQAMAAEDYQDQLADLLESMAKHVRARTPGGFARVRSESGGYGGYPWKETVALFGVPSEKFGSVRVEVEIKASEPIIRG